MIRYYSVSLIGLIDCLWLIIRYGNTRRRKACMFHVDISADQRVLVLRSWWFLLNVNSLPYRGHEYRTKGNATKVASTVHPDDINEKFNFLDIAPREKFLRWRKDFSISSRSWFFLDKNSFAILSTISLTLKKFWILYLAIKIFFKIDIWMPNCWKFEISN